FIDFAGSSFNFRSRREFIAVERISCYGPQPTALLAERVFEQHGIFIEQLLLNLRSFERLRPSQGGVTRTGRPNPRFHFLVAGGEFDNLLVKGLCQRFGLFFVESVYARYGLRVQLPLQRAFEFEELRGDALTYVGIGFGELFEQTARSRAFTRLQRRRIVPSRRLSPAQRHQQVNVKIKTALYGTEE